MNNQYYNYNYRVYGYTTGIGYQLVRKTNSYHQALSYTNKTEYLKVLIIRHNIDLKMDEPIVLETPKVKVRRKMIMNLLIRSQDKMDLFKIDRLKIREHTFENGKKEYFILNNNSISDVVGVYKTKERALEVLDEIQNILHPKGILKYECFLRPEDIEKIREQYNNEFMIIDKPQNII